MKTKTSFVDKYYIHSFIIGLIGLLFYILSINSSFLYTSIFNYSNLKSDTFNGTIYPIKYSLNYLTIKQVDRNKNFTDLDSSLFIKIPPYDANALGRDISALKPGNKDYEETMLQRVIYLTPYMGNYKHDGQENVGSHLAVDIKAPTGTPVYNIANGLITRVGFDKGGFGNFVVIRHDNVTLSDGSISTIFSSYSHLDTITVKEGEKISKGDPIGTVGETGLAVGSHLHFQIDLANAPYHPYWPFTGSEQRTAGLDFFSAINNGLGRENAMKYTINPMTFIEKNYNDSFISKEENEFLVSEETKLAISTNDVEILKNDIKEEEKIENKEEGKENIELEEKSTIAKLDLDSNIDLVNDKLLSYVPEVSVTYMDNVNKTNTNNYFFDLNETSKYYDSIKYYKEKGLIAGYNDGNFYPDSEITRLESLKILLNSYSHNPIKGKTSKFVDIDNDFWGNWYVSKALDLDLLSLDNTYFYPNRTINRVEVLKLITKLSYIDLSDYAEKNYEIKDVLKSEWEYPYVVFALDNNLFSLDNGSFYTSQTVSRGELVDLMYKFRK